MLYLFLSCFSVSEEDMDEMETTEADGEVQIVTECWVEPQFGVCINNTPERLHFEKLTSVELAKAVSTFCFNVYFVSGFVLCLSAVRVFVPPVTKLGGGILDSGCSSVRLSVCLCVTSLSGRYLPNH